jgi:choline dehydrogenase-like flavoprotein
MFDHDFVVIGSGFGGSVSALRLTEKGYRVAVLERGQGVVFRCHVVVRHERLRGAANDPIEDGRQFLVSRRRDRDEARRAGAPEALDRGYATGPRIGHSSTASLPPLPGEDGTVGVIRSR